MEPATQQERKTVSPLLPVWWCLFWAFVSLLLGTIRVGQFDPHVDIHQVRAALDLEWPAFLSSFFTPQGIFGRFHAPAYFVLVKLFSSIFGDSIIALRMFSTLGHVTLVIVSWFILNRAALFHPRQAAWALGLIAVSPPLVWWSQTAKYNMWLAVVNVLALWTALDLVQRPSRRAVMRHTACAAISFYTHYTSAISLAASLLVLLPYSVIRRPQSAKYLVGSVALATALCAPILPTFTESAREQVEEEEYHFRETPRSRIGLVDDFVTQWFVGYAINPHKGLIEFLRQRKLEDPLDWSRLLSLCLLAFATSILAYIYLLWLMILFRGGSDPTYLVTVLAGAIPLLVIGISMAMNFSVRFSYFPHATWLIILLTILTSFDVRSRIPSKLVLSSVLVLYGISLLNYYRFIERKSPDFFVAQRFLAERGNTTVVYVDARLDWMLRAGEMDPAFRRYLVFLDLEDASPAAPFYAVLFGAPEAVTSRVAAWADSHDASAPRRIESWICLEMADRSVYLYHYSPP